MWAGSSDTGDEDKQKAWQPPQQQTKQQPLRQQQYLQMFEVILSGHRSSDCRSKKAHLMETEVEIGNTFLVT